MSQFVQTHVCWVPDAIQPSHPLSSPYPLTFNLSQHQNLFQWVISSHQVAKIMKLQLQHQSFQWIFRVDFLYDWLVWYSFSPRDSQESSPAPQFESINSLALSLLYDSTVTSIHDYWKNHIALTRLTFVSKVMSQLFNMLSWFVIAFLPRSKHIFNSWLQSLSPVILETKKQKSDTVSIVSPSVCHEVMGPGVMIFIFLMLSFKPAFFTLLFHLQEAL